MKTQLAEVAVDKTPIPETPIYDRNAFLFYRENRFFLEGMRRAPVENTNRSEWGILPLMIAIGIFLHSAFQLQAFFLEGKGSEALIPIAGGVVLSIVLGAIGLLTATPMQHPAEGILLEGVVVDAEITKVDHPPHSTYIAVRYEFTTLMGNRIRQRVEAPTAITGHLTVPPPGTLVYVWYESDQKYFLL